jgi:hypothetical protein
MSRLVAGGDHGDRFNAACLAQVDRDENAHATKPHTKCMKNGILGMRSKAGGRYVTKSA